MEKGTVKNMKKKKKPAGLQKRKAISGYLFISPFIVGFLLFMVKPLFQSLYMSLSTVNVSTSGFQPVFNGIENYKKAFLIDPDFNRLLTEELGKMVVNTIAVLVFSFFVALILNQKFRGRAFVRAVFFLPVFISSGVILGVEYDNTLLAGLQETIQQSANSDTSITAAIENILVTSGVGSRVFETVFGVVDGIYDVAISSGIQILIFLSALQTISESMYEAADIEGCTAWESLWKITFPMISSMLLVNVVYTIVDFCMRTDSEVMEMITEQMTLYLDYGFSSAMAWIYFVIVGAAIGLCALFLSKVVYYYE